MLGRHNLYAAPYRVVLRLTVYRFGLAPIVQRELPYVTCKKQRPRSVAPPEPNEASHGDPIVGSIPRFGKHAGPNSQANQEKLTVTKPSKGSSSPNDKLRRQPSLGSSINQS